MSDSWQRIEPRVAERAPVVPLTTRREVVVTSRSERATSSFTH